MYMEIVDRIYTSAFTLAIDWLDVFCYEEREDPATSILPIPSEEQSSFDYGDVGLVAQPYGTPFYQVAYQVYVYGEEVATLQCHPRTLGKWKPGAAAIKMHNHVLYRSDWMDLLTLICHTLKLGINNVTRLDIALDFQTDEDPHLPELLNYYYKQMPGTLQLHMKGRATFNARDMNRETMCFQQFIIGSASSGKQVSVYNKTKEIEKSHKGYIAAFWLANGLDPQSRVYRLELRLKSEGLHCLEGFEFTLLDDPAYLASIIRTSFESFFEFAKANPGDTNTRRWEELQLFNWEAMGASLLPKTSAPVVNDFYKVRLFLHLAIKQALATNVHENLMRSNLETAVHQVVHYGVQEYASKQALKLIKKYRKMCKTPDRISLLCRLFEVNPQSLED